MVSRVASRLSYTQGSQKSVSIENNFVGGLKTEFTGMNFPENACTDTSNCVFSLTGDVTRRGGIDFEANAVLQSINTTGAAINYYRWRNAGGDGATELLVQQVGSTLYFFKSSAATTALPLSTQELSSTVSLSSFLVTGNTLASAATFECQFFDGNGYLLVTHPQCDPFYCIFSNGAVSANVITIKIRDFNGIPDQLGVQGNSQAIQTRPKTLSAEHKYNLLNQGWTTSAGWSYAQSSFTTTSFVPNPDPSGNGLYQTVSPVLGVYTVTGGSIPASMVAGDCNYVLNVYGVNGPFSVFATIAGSGHITSIGTGKISLSIDSGAAASFVPYEATGSFTCSITVYSTNTNNTIAVWLSSFGNYPSNADVWFAYLSAGGSFQPATVVTVVQPSTPAAQGHFVLNAFNQDPSNVSSVKGLTTITTTARPTTGCWFQGRAFFTGVNASQAAAGDQPFYTWTENIYFSQVIEDPSMFGLCYQTNDPTNQFFFDILPTDGGVITIQGTGAIYKLFPITNGMLIFAQNGIWFLTGGQSLGFTASDYSINKISNVQCISSNSFVNVLGMPFFWNQEGIYTVEAGQQNQPYTFGGMKAVPLTVGTILTFYNKIPLDSIVYARGAYNPNTYILQWVYRSTQETGISNRYLFDSALNLSVYTKAFYPYTITANDTCHVNGVVYMNYPSSIRGSTAQFKYPTTVGTQFTYSEENNFTQYQDWFTKQAVNYTSYFVTGYKLHGQGFKRWKPIYLYMYLRNAVASSYTIQAVWDFSTASIARSSILQTIVTYTPKFGMLFRRHKLRGHGHAMQFKVSSVQGQPFDIMGWAIPEALNIGV